MEASAVLVGARAVPLPAQWGGPAGAGSRVGALLLCWGEGTPALGLRARAASGHAE